MIVAVPLSVEVVRVLPKVMLMICKKDNDSTTIAMIYKNITINSSGSNNYRTGISITPTAAIRFIISSGDMNCIALRFLSKVRCHQTK